MNAAEAWLFPIRRASRPRLRLFAFPYAGAGAQVYCAWGRALPDGVDAWALQPPGRGSRLCEAPLRDVAAMAVAAARAVRPLLDVPSVLFGHSMGALVSFEMTRLLQAGGGPRPLHLLASGAGAPDLPSLSPRLHELPDDEFIGRLGDYNGTSREVLRNRELMALLLPMLRADFEACETYQYSEGPPLDVPVTLFGGDRDADTPPAYLEAWRRHTTAPVQVHWCAGDHFFIKCAASGFLTTLARSLSEIAAVYERVG